MSEINIFEASQLALGNALSSFAIFITIVGAYLTVAYLAAKNLSPIRIGIISSIFVVSSLSMTFTIYIFSSAGLEYYTQIKPFVGGSWLMILNVFIDLSMVLACLRFMWDSK